MSTESIKANVRVCMFDQYGTVVDMQGGLTAIATPFLKQKGWKGDPNSFVTWWRRTHFENSMIDALLQREHTPYREIGHRSVAHVMDRAGIAHTMDDVRYLVGEIEKLKPFPEVPQALARLRSKYRLVVLSNGDPDMLETAKQYHGVPFDHVISVAEANAFKPHVATYTKAAEIVGVPVLGLSPPSRITPESSMISPGLPAIFSISMTSFGATRYCLPPVRMTANMSVIRPNSGLERPAPQAREPSRK